MTQRLAIALIAINLVLLCQPPALRSEARAARNE
jgi:hypothetical protein